MDQDFYDILESLDTKDLWEIERFRVFLKDPENRYAEMRVYSSRNNHHLQDMIRKFEALPGITERDPRLLNVILSFVKDGRFHVVYQEATSELNFPLELSTQEVMEFFETLKNLHKFKITHGNINSNSFYRDSNGQLLLGSFRMPEPPSFDKPVPITLLDDMEAFLNCLKNPEIYNPEEIHNQITQKKSYNPIRFRSRNPAYNPQID